MRVNYLILCDAVIQTSGKWNALGIFSAIQAMQFPCIHPQVGVILEVTGDPGRHTLKFRLLDSSERDVSVPTDEISLTIPDIGVLETGANFGNIPLPKPGFYSVAVVVDGKELLRRDFQVLEIEG